MRSKARNAPARMNDAGGRCGMVLRRKGVSCMAGGFLFLAFVAIVAVFIVARIARKGSESGLPRCSTCATYTGCACDRPKTKAPSSDEPLKENEHVRRAN